jgi:hypothetical protein
MKRIDINATILKYLDRSLSKSKRGVNEKQEQDRYWRESVPDSRE